MTTSFDASTAARRDGPAARRGDGRFGFGVAAAGALLALLAVVERSGMPEPVLHVLALIAGALALLGIGAAMRTMRVSTFYAAGHALAPRHAGLALAGLGLALLLPLAPPAGGQVATAGLLAGFICGLGGAALICGPLLRKAGASSLADYVCLRFSYGAVRTTTALLAAAVGLLIALAGLTAASGDLMAFAGLGRPAAAALAGCLALAMLLPGGLSGGLWGAAAVAVLPLALLALSLATVFGSGRLPAVGDAPWPATLAMLGGPHLDAARWGGPFLVPALALGFAAAAPLFGPAVACRSRAAAQRAGGVALLWTLLAIAMASLAALATAVFVASGVAPTAAISLYSGFATLAGVPFALSGLLPLGFAGLGIALGAAGLHAAAAALGNDIIYSVRDRAAMTSRRLAITRALTLATAILCGLLIAVDVLDAGWFAGLALSLAAIVCAPLLALTIWPRARSRDALVVIAVGGAALVLADIAGSVPLPGRPMFVVIAAAAALASGVASSFVGRSGREHGAAFVRAVLHEPDEIATPDKGA